MKKSKIYFGKPVQTAIINFNKSDNKEEKHKLFVQKIKPAFQTIIHAIMYKYKLYNKEVRQQQQMKYSALSYAYMKLPHYNQQRGKAFSFFTVVIKNHIIIQIQRKIKYQQKFLSIDQFYQLNTDQAQNSSSTSNLMQQQQSYKEDQKQKSFQIHQLLINRLLDVIDEMMANTKCQNECNVLYGLKKVIQDRRQLLFNNRKGILLFLKQLTNQKSVYINKIIKKLKKHYQIIKYQIINQDLLEYEYRTR